MLRQPTPEENASAYLAKRRLLHKGLLAGLALFLTAVMLFAMTAAWYSNVIHTSGLLFDVSGWGLDGNVEIDEQLATAAPGSSGSIDLKVHNSSDGMISVNFNISKGTLYNSIADMRKRLYFYIDDVVYRNGEYASRIYLNSTESYSYTVLSKQSLVLGENGNGASLMWEWVYDVLGYYFYGTVNSAAAAQVTEYLRPVVYDLDTATFRDGRLATVDGETVAAFIRRLSEEDGYAGEVTGTVTDAEGKVYYPVSVDSSTGQGVWIYCCNRNEIEYESVVDTGLGNATEAADRRFQTYLNILAQQKQVAVTEVSSAQQLSTALNDNLCDLVQLSANVELTQPITVSGTSEKILDLAGHTVSSTQSDTLFTVEEGAMLTVMNGALSGNGKATSIGLQVTGGDVAMSDLVVRNVADGVRIADQTSRYNDSRVNLTNCEFYCSDSGVFIKGNASYTAADTCLTIEGCKIISTGYYAVVGNGSGTVWGTNIYIHDSTLQAEYVAVYHPQRDSTLAIAESTLRGSTPLVLKGGYATVTDTKILAGEDEADASRIDPPAFNGSGFANTGAAVYVDTSYNYPCRVTLTGNNEVTSKYAKAIILYEETNSLYEIVVSGGSYSHDVSAFTADGYVCVADNGRYVVRAE